MHRLVTLMVTPEEGFDVLIVAVAALGAVVGGCSLIVLGWLDEYWRLTHKKGR